jgi:membrane protein YqaA with SNARE-associated domain
MVTWLGVSFALAFAFAVVPVGNIELFLVGLVTYRPDLPWLALGAVVSTGQVCGKLVHYYIARDAARLLGLVRRYVAAAPSHRPAGHRSRFTSAMTHTVERARAHPRWWLTTFATSALFGLPPFAAMTIVAGIVRMRITVFMTIGLAGRFIRYSITAAAPTLVANYLF